MELVLHATFKAYLPLVLVLLLLAKLAVEFTETTAQHAKLAMFKLLLLLGVAKLALQTALPV